MITETLGELLGKANFTQVLLQMALVAGRVLPTTILAPFMGGELVQAEVKLGIGLLLSMILYPFVEGQTVPMVAFPFVGLLVKEVAIGGAIAFAASMMFETARSAGTLVDTMSGANMATAMVPQLQQQASLFADLQYQMAVVIFLTLDGHHVVINTLADSFATVPINGYPAMRAGTWPFFDLAMRSTAHLLTVAVMLAAPAGASTFLTDVSLGLVNRVAPQIQVYFLAMSLKPIVTVFMMMAAITYFSDTLVHEFALMLGDVRRTVLLLR